MIDPKRLTDADRGRAVIRKPSTGTTHARLGRIARWNDERVYVGYDGNLRLTGTPPEELEFTGGTYSAEEGGMDTHDLLKSVCDGRDVLSDRFDEMKVSRDRWKGGALILLALAVLDAVRDWAGWTL